MSHKASVPASVPANLKAKKKRYKICIHEFFCAGSVLPMALQALVKEFVGYSALFLRTIEGKPTCPQYHKLDPYKSCLLLHVGPTIHTTAVDLCIVVLVVGTVIIF